LGIAQEPPQGAIAPANKVEVEHSGPKAQAEKRQLLHPVSHDNAVFYGGLSISRLALK
jgi:hypothetical protein